MEKKISLVLPTYNERENIAEMTGQLTRLVKDLYEIIVVDDDSPDLTWKIAEDIAKKNHKVRVIRRINERGLASAIARGVDESRGNIVGWMDADLAQPPSLVQRMAEHIPEYDVVIGSRYVEGGGDKRSMLRKITSRMINLYTNFVFGNFRVRDWHTGFVLAKKSVFSEVKLLTTGYAQYCLKFLYDCQKKGFKIKELGYVNVERTKGTSKSIAGILDLFRHTWNYGIDVWKIRLGKM